MPVSIKPGQIAFCANQVTSQESGPESVSREKESLGSGSKRPEERTHDANSGAAKDLRARIGKVDHTSLGGAVSNRMGHQKSKSRTEEVPFESLSSRGMSPRTEVAV